MLLEAIETYSVMWPEALRWGPISRTRVIARQANQEGIRPDKNFAREVMQLFTIGLYELNLDGSPNRDGNLNTYPDSGSGLLPTYTQQDIEELAKVFTG